MSNTGDVAGVSTNAPGEQEVDDDAQSTVKILKLKKNLNGNPEDAATRETKDSADYQFTGVNPGSKG